LIYAFLIYIHFSGNTTRAYNKSFVQIFIVPVLCYRLKKQRKTRVSIDILWAKIRTRKFQHMKGC